MDDELDELKPVHPRLPRRFIPPIKTKVLSIRFQYEDTSEEVKGSFKSSSSYVTRSSDEFCFTISVALQGDFQIISGLEEQEEVMEEFSSGIINLKDHLDEAKEFWDTRKKP